jgi:TolB-like protein/Flp pilus assembly protein TadD
MRIFSELKRRKVIQTAAIYVAAAWILLQVADLLLGMLEVPPWGLRLVFVLLLVGFPLALILSWTSQLTPQGLRREVEPDRLEGAAARAPERTGSQPDANVVPPGGSTTVRTAPEERSIAVLPFANMSDDPANLFFAEGLSEELLNLLCRIPGLRVVARTSSFAFKGRAVSAAAIAEELHVAHLLEGSVRKSGAHLRITAQLIRGADSSHVWSQSFDRDLSDIFRVQDEIAAAVAGQLEITLLGSSAPRTRPTDAQAYSLFLQARHFLGLASATAYEQAVAALDAALAIDPEFGPAWTILGAVYWAQANNSLIGYEEGSRRARAASDKAISLDQRPAEAMSLLGFLDVLEGVDVRGGVARIERARQLEPQNPRVLTRAANIAIRHGQLDEALRLGEQSLRADPLNPVAHAIHGNSCYYAGRLEEAEAMRRRVLALSPGYLSGYFHLGRVLLARQDPAAALAAFQQEPSRFWRLAGTALGHHALGQALESDAALHEFTELELHEGGGAYQVAQIHGYRGEVDAAFAWLRRSVEARDSGLTYAAVDPLLAHLHDDPRWPGFLKENGLGSDHAAAMASGSN